jgi:hypothetical protein
MVETGSKIRIKLQVKRLFWGPMTQFQGARRVIGCTPSVPKSFATSARDPPPISTSQFLTGAERRMRVQRCRRDRPSAPNNAREPRRHSIVLLMVQTFKLFRVNVLTGKGTYLR